MERDKTYQLQPPRNPPGQRVGHGESGLGTYDVSHERVVRVGLGYELLNGSQQGCDVEGWSPGTLDRWTDRQAAAPPFHLETVLRTQMFPILQALPPAGQ